MSIISSFGDLFDRALVTGFANYTTSNDVFEVNEQDSNPNVRTRHLSIEWNGATFASFNHMLVKSMDDITGKRSSKFLDCDCDGIAIVSYRGREGLIFSELKSRFDTKKIIDAYCQMTHSFLKMHAMLSLCKDYKIDELSLQFIAACQCFEDKNQEDSIYNRLSKQEQLDKTSFVSKFLRRLIEHHDVTVVFGEVAAAWNLPLSQALVDKEITLSLQFTRNFGDSSLVYSC